MKIKNQNPLTQYAIPDGEGSTALPIAFFISVIAPLKAGGVARAAARSNPLSTVDPLKAVDPIKQEIASRRSQ